MVYSGMAVGASYPSGVAPAAQAGHGGQAGTFLNHNVVLRARVCNAAANQIRAARPAAADFLRAR
jgi:hypothetical protein